jgi:hypothetical protein
MTRDDIIRMAREAGLYDVAHPHPAGNNEAVERFAALVAAAEREACAQIAMQWDKEHPSTNFGGCIARSIRARSSHEQG